MEENNHAAPTLSDLRDSLRIPLAPLEEEAGGGARAENRAAAREQAGLLRQKRRSEKAASQRRRARKGAAVPDAAGEETAVPAEAPAGAIIPPAAAGDPAVPAAVPAEPVRETGAAGALTGGEEGALVLPLSAAEGTEAPKTRWQTLFGTDRFFAVSTLCCGGLSVIWALLYWFMIGERSASFRQAAVTMAQQGRADYTVIFSSPLLTLLKVLLGILAAFSVMWAVSAVLADRKRSDTGKKWVLFAVLGLLLFVGGLTLYDLGAAGLVFDVMKQ